VSFRPPVTAAPPQGATTAFSRSGFLRGFKRAQPLAVGTFAYGIAFGLLAREAGLAPLEAVLMSATVYSGSAQLAAVSQLGPEARAAGIGFGAIVATILLLNARYVLYGATLRPWLGALPAWKSYPSLFVLGDGNWILAMRAWDEGERDAAFVIGSGAAMFTPWLAGTLTGSFAGTLLADPARFGLDFLLVSFSAAMGVAMFRSRSDLWTVGVALAAALGINAVAPGGWTIVGAGLAGGLAAWLRASPGASRAFRR